MLSFIHSERENTFIVVAAKGITGDNASLTLEPDAPIVSQRLGATRVLPNRSKARGTCTKTALARKYPTTTATFWDNKRALLTHTLFLLHCLVDITFK